MICWLLTDDLMFQSQCEQIIKLGHATCRAWGSCRQMLDDISTTDVDHREAHHVIVLDLTTIRGGELEAELHGLAREARSVLPNVRLIAVGPHVHRGPLQIAHDAGWHTCVRGQVQTSLHELLAAGATGRTG